MRLSLPRFSAALIFLLLLASCAARQQSAPAPVALRTGPLPVADSVVLRSGLEALPEDSALFAGLSRELTLHLEAQGFPCLSAPPVKEVALARKNSRNTANPFVMSQLDGRPTLPRPEAIPGFIPEEALRIDGRIARYTLVCRLAQVAGGPPASGDFPTASGPDSSGPTLVLAAQTIQGVDRLDKLAPMPSSPPQSAHGATPGDFARGYEGNSPDDPWHRDADFKARNYEQRHTPEPAYAEAPKAAPAPQSAAPTLRARSEDVQIDPSDPAPRSASPAPTLRARSGDVQIDPANPAPRSASPAPTLQARSGDVQIDPADAPPVPIFISNPHDSWSDRESLFPPTPPEIGRVAGPLRPEPASHNIPPTALRAHYDGIALRFGGTPCYGLELDLYDHDTGQPVLVWSSVVWLAAKAPALQAALPDLVRWSVGKGLTVGTAPRP